MGVRLQLRTAVEQRGARFFGKITNMAIVQWYRELICQKAYILLCF